MAQFQPGQAKPLGSGRRKGTPNKNTLTLLEALQANGIDPANQLCKLLPKLKPNERAHVLLQLMSFIYPKRKAIDINPVEDNAPIESFNDLVTRIANEREI